MTDLRAELLGATDERPELAVLLPTGWVLRRGDVDDFRREAVRTVDALPAELQQRVGPGLRALAAQATAAARSARGELVGVIRQESVPPEQYVPMSLALSWMRPPSGSTVQQLGERLIATRGAAPMSGAPGILRWLEPGRVEAEGESGEFGGPCYLVPVDGRRDAALLVRATLPMPDDVDERMRLWRDALFLLGDSIVATIRWRRDAAADGEG